MNVPEKNYYDAMLDTQYERDELVRVCELLLEELLDLYDGAPDSRTRWMGVHIDNLTNAIANARVDRVAS